MKNEFGNTNSKDIWGNTLLCAQFLRGYTELPLFEDVQPEDIEDITEKLRPFVGVEYDGDAVKKVHLRGENEKEVYVVALLEHKSEVDHDVTFQLLKYMVGIWNIYRNQQNAEKDKSSARKSFRYPLIIPIVYYEGSGKWTAAMHWKERVELSELFGEYVPDFTYRVVEVHSYSREELLSKEEELSLVMILNGVQTMEDLDVSRWSAEGRKTAERIVRKAPEAVLRLLTQMVHHVGLKLNLPDDELKRCVKNMEDLEMGELWANMEKMDIQAERRNTQEARRERDEVKKELEEIQRESEEKLAQKDRELADAQEKIEAIQEEIARLKKLLQEQGAD